MRKKLDIEDLPSYIYDIRFERIKVAYSKAEQFDKDIAQLSAIAKSLSHPVRIKILQILAEKNACICGEIVDLLPLSQSTVSQHLKELKRVGLIYGETEGPKTCYCLNKGAIDKAKAAFSTIFLAICKCKNKGEIT